MRERIEPKVLKDKETSKGISMKAIVFLFQFIILLKAYIDLCLLMFWLVWCEIFVLFESEKKRFISFGCS